jgi:hypothetical protein
MASKWAVPGDIPGEGWDQMHRVMGGGMGVGGAPLDGRWDDKM